jgi:NADH-quinone oxidoreductase subunit F
MSHNLVSLRRKHAARDGVSPASSVSVIDALRAEMDGAHVLSSGAIARAAAKAGVPESVAHGVATYYSDFSLAPRGARRVHVCMGTSCMASTGGAHVKALAEACGVALGETAADGSLSLEPVYCLGLCHASPAVLIEDHGTDGAPARHAHAPLDEALAHRIAKADASLRAEPEPAPRIESHVTPTVLLGGMLEGRDDPSLATARARGAYEALTHADGARVLDEVERSTLRGRGGAGFPTVQKWRSAAAQPPGEKFVVCNADEGDPGSYIDKLLLERDPHLVLEGMALTGRAIGASRGVIYLRSEYPVALERVRRAIDEARAADVLGGFEISLAEGAGSYVCGEETALLRSIEGLRGMVTARPPYPAVKGLFERPTVVNNVETLATVPWIVRHGGAAFAAIGVGKSRGTKVVSLSALLARPGLYEVALGTSLRTIVEELGGGLRDGKKILAVQIGGPLGGIVPAALFDTPLGFEELDAVGGLLGHGGIVAFAEGTDMRALAHHLFAFGDAESCGKCVPCRIGMRRGRELLEAMTTRGGTEDDLALLEVLLETMQHGSLCAHGGGLPAPIRSILAHHRSALLAPGRDARRST